MKKKLTWHGNDLCCQLLRKMKITILLLLVSIASVFAVDSYAQATKLTLQLSDKAIKEVLYEVEEQSEFRFFYNENVNVDKKISVDIKNKTVFDVLDEILDETNIQYRVIGRQIALYNETEGFTGLSAQQSPVSGKVTSEKGEPLPGVTVVINGTSTGTVTGSDGTYSVNALGNDILTFSFIGMKTQEVSVNNRTTINVLMEEENIGIEEVVAIGYGTRQKKDLTGAVSQITANDITKQNTLSAQMAMQGKMPGVYISNPGSNPTARPTIRIRGVGTLGFNDPLYVVDGIPLTEGGASSTAARDQDQRGNVNVLNMINPNDIESISVLKDASASAIYGVRASNGVILITTKRGKEGKANVDISANYGIQNNWKKYELSTMQEYIDWSHEAKNANPAYKTDQYYPLFDPTSPDYMGNSDNYTQDWLDAARVKNARVQDYNISVSGGNRTSTYATGAGYANQQNAFFYNEYDRFSLFFNSDHKLTKWLKIGESFRFVYTNYDEKATTGQSVMFGVPWQPVYDENGPKGFAPVGRTFSGSFKSYGYGAATQNNFLGIAEYRNVARDLLRNMGTLYAEISPIKGLRFKGTFSFDYYANYREVYEEIDRGLFEVTRGTPYPTTTGNTYGRRTNDNINLVKEFLIGYTNTFGKHNVDLVLNAMDQQVKWNVSQMGINTASPITSWDQRRIEEGWDNANKGSHYERNRSGLQGYMGRLSYNFDSKYYLDATVRRDGTSKFGPGYKWGTFPSFAAAWRVTSEKFMESTEWLNDLKIRAGWGQSGNQETRDYAFLSLVNMNPKASFGTSGTLGVGNGTIYPASALGDFPIADMSWETVTTSNFGFDAILFDNKLSFTAEYYNRFTEGILQTISIPKVIGALNNPVVNLAEVSNQGFEFQIGYNNQKGDFSYGINANLTTIKNEVEKLYNGQPSTNGNLRIEEGYSMNYIYGYKTAGIFQTAEEVAAWKAKTTDAGRDAQKSPGDIIFSDIYGAPKADDPKGTYVHKEPDGKIDAYDQTYLGKTIPGFFYGINLDGSYKNWDVSMNFNGVGDVQKINTNGKQSISGFGQQFLTEYRDRWTSTNPSNTIPRAVQNDPSGNNRISDRHVENAGFLRFQNFQVGYNFSGTFLQKMGLSNLRCYFAGTNLFVITPFNDLDPEDITTPLTLSVGATLSF
jgi:TonB-linked SusC/RagA family outer membrane protein